jgi:hypothetical protein
MNLELIFKLLEQEELGQWTIYFKLTVSQFGLEVVVVLFGEELKESAQLLENSFLSKPEAVELELDFES